jgi:uncharacterized protein (TIGR03118 family)
MSDSSQSSPRRSRNACLALMVGTATLAAFVAPAGSAAAGPAAKGFKQVNLVSDVPGLARITDFRVSNPWGIALGPKTPIWINNNNTATSEVYAGANGHTALSLKLVVQTPAGPTGIVFNPTKAFAAHQHHKKVPTAFLFDGFDGYTSGWGPTANPITDAIPVKFDRMDGYLGLALARTKHGPRLYEATFSGDIDVLGPHFHDVTLPAGAFEDPSLPAGLAPYNVAVLNHRIYVTYADPNGGPGGAIATYRFNGSFIKQLTADSHLNAPWGITMSPKNWGGFGNDLLVGNVNDGRISAFNPTTGAFKGQLKNAKGKVISNSGLWGLEFGNGLTGTPRDLLFAAGIDGYSHGLFGLIHPN